MGCQQKSCLGRWGQLTAELVCLLGLGNLVMGQSISQDLSGWDPTKSTCNMDWAQGVVLGNKMYLDGGELVDQNKFKYGTDQPFPKPTPAYLTRWQSECPSV